MDWSKEEGQTVFRLPRSHWHAQLSNFEWDGLTPKSLEERIATFITQVRDGGAPHIVMTGRPGIGKSHIGVGVYRTLSSYFGTALVTWVNVPAFCDAVKSSYGGEVDPWTDYEGARRCVVLDDLFGRDLSQHEVSQIVYRLIDTAYQNGAAMLVNMNQEIKDVQARLASHEISRLVADGLIIPMEAPKDRRRG
jgi:DNA replication protein DnaC